MSLLISYDIEDNYLRQKIANHVLDAGLARVQYSVYIVVNPGLPGVQ